MNITTIGGHARRWLDQGTRGRVAAVFDDGCYLRHRRQPLLCLMSRKRSPGPINLLYADEDWDCRDAVRVGDRWECGTNVLRVGDASFRFHRAATWRAPAGALDWTPRRLEEGLRRVADASESADTGILLPLALNRRARRPAPLEARIARRARLGVDAFREWLADSLTEQPRAVEIPQDAEALLGLGPGLTPAGDDFVVGMLVALHGLQLEATAEVLAAWVKRKAGARTNEISVAHLLAACDGEASAPVHAVLNALIEPDQPDLGERVHALAALGHSSGWDALGGVLTVCEARTLRREVP
ncbi:MAG: DUF2877 domain-containing protein [Gammaproteobacteria bacterium]|nr:DUF2877 domain-containing protein [Gammaproteobacteria bacterium]NIP87607.1 DUF2877 domain-containing protein [Gammaproteobacteria bacterium]NIR21932.1 DUF2877 domain-containing protein [Gammaproteobacteria bacterium]NIS03628.1 DUF2877 domain-containing protein [Gammaproteobacteria bacterium]NIU40642.1 DUF2877 domain-containing protein [Gammaproteobacteria bacterium]